MKDKQLQDRYDIFISYSRKNLADVKPIKKTLEGLGFSCWFDLRGIESGSRQFSQKIIDAIDASAAVLFFLSSDSQVSEWALKEIDYAYEEKKHVVLVRFNDDCMTKQFRFDFNRADIIDWRRAEQKEKLVRDLRRWADQINQTSESSSTVPAQRPLKSSSAPTRKTSSPKKKKLPISLDFVYSDTRELLDIGWGVRFYCLKVKNHNRGPISVTISVRNGGKRAVYRNTIEGNSIEIYRTLGMSWRFKHGDQGTIKVLGWSKCLKFRLDEGGVVIS